MTDRDRLKDPPGWSSSHGHASPRLQLCGGNPYMLHVVMTENSNQESRYVYLDPGQVRKARDHMNRWLEWSAQELAARPATEQGEG